MLTWLENWSHIVKAVQFVVGMFERNLPPCRDLVNAAHKLMGEVLELLESLANGVLDEAAFEASPMAFLMTKVRTFEKT